MTEEGDTEHVPNSWTQRGFAAFSRGEFGSGGDNLYVSAKGEMSIIHRTDVNNDGFVDIVLPNAHGYSERGSTRIYTPKILSGVEGPDDRNGTAWPRHELPNDSGWMSRVVDVDGDGYNDLIVVNGENGVTSELESYIYWHGSCGLTGERTEFPTAGAYDVAVFTPDEDGLPALIFPSAWVDHHNPGRPRLIQVFEQTAPRQFVDASERYGLMGVAAVAVACEDLTGNGFPDLVVANYRDGFEYDTDSFVYWGTANGFDRTPLRLPTHYAMQTIVGDLNGNGWKDIVFAGGDRISIFWNDAGTFSPERVSILEAAGMSTMFCVGAVRVEIADVDGDGRNELIVATAEGVEIRTQDDLSTVRTLLSVKYCSWVSAADLAGVEGSPVADRVEGSSVADQGRLDLLVSCYQDGRFYETSSAVFWNGPDGFSPDRVSWFDSAGAMGITSGDLDGDGKPEIIVNNTMGSWSQYNPDFPLYVYLGNETHEYGPERRLELPTGGQTNSYVIADTDQDGYPELIVPTMAGVRIFTGAPDGPQADRYIDLPNLGRMFMYVLPADLNRNGWLDLIGGASTDDATPERMANSSVIYWGGPEGYSIERSTSVPTYTSGECFVTDVNNDGWLEFIYVDKRGFVGIFLGGPDGFSPERMVKIPLAGQEEPTIAVPNCADLNGNGWLDLIVAVLGHYDRRQSGFYIFDGGPDGYSPDRSQFHPTEAASILISAADIDNNGCLDLLVPAYSTQFRRDLPAFIFPGTGDGFDFDDPFVMACDACCAFSAIDITGNGYRDVLAVCHRDDIGHQVDSLLYWNGPEGLSPDRVTRLPGLGPHLAGPRDFGNTYTREPREHYTSPAKALQGLTPTRMTWDADVPANTALEFQLRWAATEQELLQAPWCGPDGEGSCYTRSGQALDTIRSATGEIAGAAWMQYSAVFVSLNGCSSPTLREVRIELRERMGAG